MFKLIDATSVRRTRGFIREHYPNAQIDGEPIAFPEARLRTTARWGPTWTIRDVVLEIDDNLSLARYQPDDFPTRRSTGSALGKNDRRSAAHRPPQAVRFERARLPPDSREVDHRPRRVLTRSTPDRSGPRVEALARLGGRRPSGACQRAPVSDSLPATEYKAGELPSGDRLRPRDPARVPRAGRGCGGDEARGARDSPPRGARHGEGDRVHLLRRHCGLDRTGARERSRSLRRSPPRRGHRNASESAPNGCGACTSSPRRRRREAGSEEVSRRTRRISWSRTDVLSEGQNLQQARYIVNYDMPWNPMRLVQRNGRIDRLGSPFAGQEIYLYNLFPGRAREDSQSLRPAVAQDRPREHQRRDGGAGIRGCGGGRAKLADVREQIEGVAARTRRSRGRRRRVLMRFRVRSSGSTSAPRSQRSGWRSSVRCRTEQEAGSHRIAPQGRGWRLFGARVLLGPRLEPSPDDERAWRYVDLGACSTNRHSPTSSRS